MKNGAKRLIPLLTSVVMVCSLAVVSASASGGGMRSKSMAVTVDTAQQRFIYANHPANTAEGLKELAGTIEGTRGDGSSVNVAARWNWDSRGSWAFRPEGCAGDNYGFYRFKASSLTVSGGGGVTANPHSVSLEVMVIAVNARQSFETASGIVSRSRISRFTGENWKEALGLPDTVNVTYAPAQITDHPEWNAAAGTFSAEACTYKISGWEINDPYVLLTPTTLQNAVDAGKREIRLTPIYASADQGGRPDWATLDAVPRFTLIIADDCLADVTVTPPGDITYGGELGNPVAAQPAVRGGTFTYRYEGVEGTVYDSEKKPTGAGTYRVTATLDSLTHTGTGTSAPFTIRRAAGAAAADITVPASGGTRTVYLNGMGLPDGMAAGVRLKEAPAADAGDVLAGVTGVAGGTFFTIRMNPARAGSSQSFPLVLTGDNYEELTVTAATNAGGFNLTHVAVKEPGVFEYGTSLRDIIDLEQCAAIVNGADASGTFELVEPNRRYGVGEDTTIQLRFKSRGRTYSAKVSAAFTIQPVKVTFLGWDEAFIRDGYWITTYANSPYYTDAGMLRMLIQDRKQTFTVSCAAGQFLLDATWSADDGNPPFEPGGQKPHQVEDVIWYDWYAYTAALTPRGADAANFALDDIPKAYIRAVPVNAILDGGGGAKTVTAAAVASLTAENWRAVLGLPETVCVRYEPVDRPEWSDEYVPVPDGVYTIAGWKLDGIILAPENLRAKAAEAVNGDVKLTLTPVYAGVPAWATVIGAQTFELTITSNGRSN